MTDAPKVVSLPHPIWRRRWHRWRGLPFDALWSAFAGIRRRDDFAMVQSFALFVGYPRSGKSLLRALVGAHPEVVIADELDVLRYVQLGFRRHQLGALILRRDRRQRAERLRSGSTDYLVPIGGQDLLARPRTLGDNKGGATTRHLQAHPDLLDRLERRMGVPVRLLHVTRNPYDNIASIELQPSWTAGLAGAVEVYAELCEGMAQVRAQCAPETMLDLRHEDLLADPGAQVAAVCRFLGVVVDAHHLDACERVVRSEPERTRHQVRWTPELRARVAAVIAAHPFLAGYRWES